MLLDLNNRKRSLLLTLATVIVMAGVFFPGLQAELAAQQSVSIGDVWPKVYQQLPDFPKENQYISKDTGKQASTNTLVSRLMAYHVYVRGRAPIYRLDWKLTLADYLGINEPIYDSNYPGNETLRKNPLDGDTAVIRRLNHTQRDALVQALVNAFNPGFKSTTPAQETTPIPQPSKPGSAEQLR